MTAISAEKEYIILVKTKILFNIIKKCYILPDLVEKMPNDLHNS